MVREAGDGVPVFGEAGGDDTDFGLFLCCFAAIG